MTSIWNTSRRSRCAADAAPAAEALLRATGPEGRQQAPLEFLRGLAQAGLMRDVDLWVARQAVVQCQSWRAQGFALPMTINVTSGTLTSTPHLEKLIGVLAQAGGQVSVELTEDALVEDAEALHMAFDRLRQIGARIYIDDFGTGYSALSYLHQFRIDAVKIDRSFVQAQSSERGALVMSGLLRFCEALNLQIVVEGVETDKGNFGARIERRNHRAGLVLQQGAARRADGLRPAARGRRQRDYLMPMKGSAAPGTCVVGNTPSHFSTAFRPTRLVLAARASAAWRGSPPPRPRRANGCRRPRR